MCTIRILSPHIDDAFLSIGGSILNWRSKGIKVKVYNIFSISDWTSPNSISGLNYLLDVRENTDLRKNEEKEVGELTDFKYEFWNFLDFPLREGFSQTENENMEDEILNKLQQCLNFDDVFFFPLGVGHVDHVLIHEISVKFIDKGYNISYFEDMPHLSWGNLEYKSFYDSQTKTKFPVCEKINFTRKADIAKRYKSQVTGEWINSIKTYAYNQLDNEYYERYWNLKK